jgi:hypothetical protein
MLPEQDHLRVIPWGLHPDGSLLMTYCRGRRAGSPLLALYSATAHQIMVVSEPVLMETDAD